MLNKKIIITGAAGFIGLNLLNSIIKRKNLRLEIFAVDNLKTSNLLDFKQILKANKFKKKKKFFYKNRIKIYFIKKSFAKLNNTKLKNLNNIDCLIHLAAQTGVVQSMKYPEKDAEENIINSIKLFQFLRDRKINKIIFASSMGVLGDNLLSSNLSSHNPLNFYAASKSSVENYLNVFKKTFGIKTFILRFSNIYGRFSKKKSSVIANFFKSIIKNRRVSINGSGNQYRDFLYVDDLVEVIEKLSFSMKYDFLDKKPIHVATGKSFNINQLVKIFRKDLGIKFKILKKKGSIGDIQKSFIKINEVKKLKKDFTSIKKGLKITYQWYKKFY